MTRTTPRTTPATATQTKTEAGSEDLRHMFREAMASLAATACLVTAREGDRRLGRTVTATFSLNVNPPRILVSVAATSALAAMVQRKGAFSFAMLAEDQATVADAFAGKTAAERRFEHGDWAQWSSGHPRLLGAVASMDCVVAGEIELEGHILFVGAPHQMALDAGRPPLVWHHRRYNSVQPL
ncbi:flavin reductase family protein [Celeribacter indicus]|uniref:Flavin reductase like domain-containing protein n=1 Tax=Celeribacter indicus TaxID=1208324 RepID=A0A0B5E170_9RHOB|nr:flavin reductase family protein [Celeribacter indicus]AJE49034.1 hypothetical protein P73_4319 [Celeribacter indicus]SDW44237.1 flavin reductase [Celeribacter indicus]